MAGRPKSPFHRRNGMNFVNLGFDEIPPFQQSNPPSTPVRRSLCGSVTDVGQCATKSSLAESGINGRNVLQNCSIDFNPLTMTGRGYGANGYTRYRSMSATDCRRYSHTGSIYSYRPNSSHQYLGRVDLKDSTIHEANVHLGKPTRTSLLRSRLRRTSAPSSARSVDSTERSDTPVCVQPPKPGSVSNLLCMLASKDSRSLHGFLTGGRYNRSSYINLLGAEQRRKNKSECQEHELFPPASTPVPTPDVPLEILVDNDDSASNSSNDSFEVLPDLRPGAGGPEPSGTSRAHSALRRSRPHGNAINATTPCVTDVERSAGQRPLTAKTSTSRPMSSRNGLQRRVAWSGNQARSRSARLSTVDDESLTDTSCPDVVPITSQSSEDEFQPAAQVSKTSEDLVVQDSVEMMDDICQKTSVSEEDVEEPVPRVPETERERRVFFITDRKPGRGGDRPDRGAESKSSSSCFLDEDPFNFMG